LWIDIQCIVHALVPQWLHNHRDQIEKSFLPPYSPQLNPAEYLNCDVKQGVHSKPPTRNLTQLTGRLRSHLLKLQKLPARIVKYFQHPFIAYAA
jgi:transposase